jgi:DNA helicase II / ATP-dependent DNA helicase PcrA
VLQALTLLLPWCAAGPGSGKTRVVASRVAQLAASGVSARNMLVITFTNKAADELKERVAKALRLDSSDKAGMPTAGTFHSFCVLLLR